MSVFLLTYRVSYVVSLSRKKSNIEKQAKLLELWDKYVEGAVDPKKCLL